MIEHLIIGEDEYYIWLERLLVSEKIFFEKFFKLISLIVKILSLSYILFSSQRYFDQIDQRKDRFHPGEKRCCWWWQRKRAAVANQTFDKSKQCFRWIYHWESRRYLTNPRQQIDQGLEYHLDYIGKSMVDHRYNYGGHWLNSRHTMWVCPKIQIRKCHILLSILLVLFWKK